MHWRFFAAGLTVAAALLPLTAHAELTLPQALETCESCHGPDGTAANLPDAPVLAGLDKAYLVRQLEAFKSGERPSDLMSSTLEDIPATLFDVLASHYAQLDGEAPLSADEPIAKDQAERGRTIAEDGVAGLLAGCATCHGPNGQGVGGTTPALAGQKPAYIEARLLAWRDDEAFHGTTGIARIMTATAQKLSDADIAAVAAFYGSLDAAGNERVALNQRPTPAPYHETVKPRDRKGLDLARMQAISDKWKKADSSGKLYEHTPPAFDTIPDGPEGDMIRYGRHLYNNTQVLRGKFVGNDMACRNCHMKDGISAGLAPMWGVPPLYPNYRGKNKHVNTLEERIAGCFTYSMNGTPPSPRSDEMVALMSYAAWSAQGIPLGSKPRGTLYDKIDAPAEMPTYERGKKVYFDKTCNACHGDDGQGQKAADGHVVYPPLWGPNSYNWGAGMHTLEKAAAFIKKAMPLNSPDLTVQEAWDVAYFMNSHERPQDPRWTGSVDETQALFHSGGNNIYGTELPGTNHILGDIGAPLDKPKGE